MLGDWADMRLLPSEGWRGVVSPGGEVPLDMLSHPGVSIGVKNRSLLHSKNSADTGITLRS